MTVSVRRARIEDARTIAEIHARDAGEPVGDGEIPAIYVEVRFRRALGP
jgi:hypothetical protein